MRVFEISSQRTVTSTLPFFVIAIAVACGTGACGCDSGDTLAICTSDGVCQPECAKDPDCKVIRTSASTLGGATSSGGRAPTGSSSGGAVIPTSSTAEATTIPT